MKKGDKMKDNNKKKGLFVRLVMWARSLGSEPKKLEFYDLFQMQVEEIRNSSTYLRQLMQKSLSVDEKNSLHSKIKKSETIGDNILREISKLTNESVTSPFPRQDILNLARLLDDVLDGIEGAADNFIYYQVSKFNSSYLKMATIIDDGAELLTRVVPALEKFEHPMEIYAEMRELEHQADEINKTIIPKSYLAANTATSLDEFKILWIEAITTDKIITRMEKTADSLRHVTDTIKGVIAKRV